MGHILIKYPSRSKEGQWYDVIQGNDGVIYCNCWQWKLNRTCKHLEDYKRNHKPGEFIMKNETEKQAIQFPTDDKEKQILEIRNRIHEKANV